MWLITKDGLFSIVHKNCKKDELIVRARVRADLENMLKKIGSKADIIEGGGTDYKFRCVMKRGDVVEYLSEYVFGLDYDNFKNTLPHNDHIRHNAYFGIWSAGMRLQNGDESSFWP